ncbi:procathepsin L-like isoform X2 [Mustelus asterias]
MKLSLFLGCVLLSILVVASGHTFDSRLNGDWKIWKSQHEKQYTEEEETRRRSIWEDNVRYIEQHNLEYSMGKHTFTVGMNEFGDLTDKEFNERMNGFLPIQADNSTEEVDGDELDEDVESDGGEDELDEDVESDGGEDELDEDVESDGGDDELDEDVESDGGEDELDEDVESDGGDDELHGDVESDGGDDELDEDEESDDDLTRVFVDWRRRGYVTAVKNQRNCGSCWAFSATGAIEGQWRKVTGKLIPLSEQDLVDCSRSFGTHGCRGGWMSYAFAYVLRNGGINSARDYPYTARVNTCKFQKTKFVAKIRGFRRVKRRTRRLARAVRRIGPISVAIDAGGPFRWYKRGIYRNRRCKTRGVNHAVLVVGYGRQGRWYRRRWFWLVKNSWGTSWGDRGYIKMAMRVRKNCGITRHAIYPIV